MYNQHNKWTIWFKLLYISVIVIAFGLLCLLIGYWTAFIKYVRLVTTNTRAFHHIPYELYFICSGALFAIIGSFIYSRVTRTIDSFNEHLSNYILFNNNNNQQQQQQQSNHRIKPHYQPQILSTTTTTNNLDNRSIIITT
ncbi:hypothetical protein DERP_014330 [Dermatophagoides pteronyssinus]|uniref:Uncharacterized protein n=1 Tax=Dermatophagoides pteronyssinus TaxID=6956 RepID=A0ABQ8JWS2_DERPT|nr:hypothetical protein DERP_014330 [Dermatophagoides pteronyssinus]